MSSKRVADVVVDTLVNAGVRRVYGIAGDSLNGITDAIRGRKEIVWAHVRTSTRSRPPAPSTG
jgi:pyruvate dehydrogenase (quinone)